MNDSGKELGNERWQPVDEREWRRHPPARADCVRVRMMLRDYADGDLGDDRRALAEARAGIEEHVHECRDCALALSRTEHEVLRLRRAYAGEACAAPVGFTESVVRALVRELAEERPGTESPGRRSRGFRPALATAAAALLVAVLAVGIWRPWESEDAMGRCVLVHAREVVVDDGVAMARPRQGDPLPAGVVVAVARDGQAQIDWRPEIGNQQPSGAQGRFTLGAESRLRVGPDRLQLLEGEVDVVANGPLGLAVGDGSLIAMRPGRYHVAALSYRSFDDVLRGDHAGLRVLFEVIEGGPARVMYHTESAAVYAGEVARYGGWTPIEIGPASSDEELLRGLRGGDPDPTVPVVDPSRGLGRVLEVPSGAPVPGVPVEIASAGSAFPQAADTGGAGQFQVAGELSGEFAVVGVWPEAAADLEPFLPQPMALDRPDGRQVFAEDFALRRVPAVDGRIRDDQHRRLDGARLVPCVVDELLGRLLPLRRRVALSNERGEFSLRGLPGGLPVHHALVLLCLRDGYRPRVVPLVGPFTASDMEIELVADSGVQVVGLPSRRTVELWEEIPGLPRASAVRVHQGTTDSNGELRVALLADAVVWWRQGGITAGTWRLVRAVDGASRRVDRSAAVGLPPCAAADRPWLPLRKGADEEATRVLLADDHRYRVLTPPRGATPDSGWLIAAVEKTTNRPLESAHVFALESGGAGAEPLARFLGSYDARLGVRAELCADTVLVVGIDRRGGVGIAMPGATPGKLTVELHPPGAVLLGAALRPSATDPVQRTCLRLRMHGGPLVALLGDAVFTRWATVADGWRLQPLPPGDYEVVTDQGIRNVRVTSGQQTILD